MLKTAKTGGGLGLELQSPARSGESGAPYGGWGLPRTPARPGGKSS
jgi:hypothetical protein